MPLLDDAKQCMLDLSELTEGIARGAPPDVHSVLGYQARLVRYHALLGEEMAKKFGGKERAYIQRKVDQAREHARRRVELKLTSKDSEEAAFLAVQRQYDDEI